MIARWAPVAAMAALSAVAPADTLVRVGEGAYMPLRREVIGANHLAYGKDGLGYGMILPGSHDLDPQLVAWQREIGFGSLRYPGGCGGTHRFEWKRNAGLEGDYSVMGVVEFLAMCEESGATPILGISAHRGTPQEAAEYVEFLNAPADAAHPWAQRRSERGHPAPYNAVWFEYGNETYHGMTCSTYKSGRYPIREISADDYCDAYLAFRDAMRSVDPRVKLGAPISGGGSLWDKILFARLGGIADFFVVHSYASVPEVHGGEDFLRIFTERTEYLKKRFAEITNAVGPQAAIAVTEFNARHGQHTTLAAGLVNLSTLMDLAAEPRVALADCWQFVNEGFGMVRGERGAFVKRPTAWAFQLFSRHTFDTFVPTEVLSANGGRESASPLTENSQGVGKLPFAAAPVADLRFSYREGGTPENTGTRYTLLPGGVHRLEFLDDRQTNFYQLSALLNGLSYGSGFFWKVSCEMWTEPSGDAPVEAWLELVDGRGWDSTRSAAAGDYVSGIDPIDVSFLYEPLEDNPGSLLLRFRRTGTGAAGAVFVRNLCIEAVPKTHPQEPAVRAQLSVSADGKHSAAVLLNRSFEPQNVALDFRSLVPDEALSSVTATVLTGPSAFATNESNPFAVQLMPLEIAPSRDGIIRLTMPPHSAAGVRIGGEGEGLLADGAETAAPVCRSPETRVVAREPGRYESWPFVETIGGRIVIVYSDGERHNAGERGRGVLSKTSDDGGRTWSAPVPVVQSPEIGATAVGKGRDSGGRMLLWVRTYGGDSPGFDLYRTADGKTFERIAHLQHLGKGGQIMDVVRIDGRLVSLWFSGDYKTPETFAWGTLESYDDGITWKRRTIESGMPLPEWPTEPAMIHLGGGRILGIARTEEAGGTLFSLVSEDGGATWSKRRTNIGDVMKSTPSLLFDSETGTVSLYYYERGKRLLKRRTASADAVFADPGAWPEPEIVAHGDELRATDAGNPNAAALGRRHFVVWYSGAKRPDAAIYLTIVPPRAASVHGKEGL